MGAWTCDRCGNEHEEAQRKCDRCGAAGVWYRPTLEDIRSECEEIRSGWSETREASSSRWAIATEVQIEIRTRARGRRVMRESND